MLCADMFKFEFYGVVIVEVYSGASENRLCSHRSGEGCCGAEGALNRAISCLIRAEHERPSHSELRAAAERPPSETVGLARGVCSQLPTRLGWVTADAVVGVSRARPGPRAGQAVWVQARATQQTRA